MKPLVAEVRVLLDVDVSIEEVTGDVQLEEHQFGALVRPGHVPADDRHVGTELGVGARDTLDHLLHVGPFDVLQLFVGIGVNRVVLLLPHGLALEGFPARLIPMPIGRSTGQAMRRLIDVVEDGIVIRLLLDATGTEDQRFHLDRRRRRVARGDDANRGERSISSDQTLDEIMIGKDFLDDPVAVIAERNEVRTLEIKRERERTTTTYVAKLSKM